MKKISTLIVVLFVAFQMTSCGSDKKGDKKEKKVSDAAFVLSDAKSKIEWDGIQVHRENSCKRTV